MKIMKRIYQFLLLAAGCAARDPVPVWVAMPGYRIVPPEVGDTMALPAAYSLFRKDVAEMLDRVYKLSLIHI